MTNSSVKIAENDTIKLVSLPDGFTHRQLARAISPKIQEFILLPTEKCNFRCTYCYEDFEIGKMSLALQAGIEKLLLARIPQLKNLRFSWFGGEPLLAKDVVLRLSRFAKKLCDDNAVVFSGGLTTNAYLLERDLAAELVENNQNFFQITLDGTAEEHDQLRRRADGAGTFDKIWRNLESMKEINGDFDCQIRLHLRKSNLKNMEVLVAEIAKEFGNDKRYRIDYQHLRNMGGEGGKTVVDPLKHSQVAELEMYYDGIFQRNRPVQEGDASSFGEDEYTPIRVKAANAGESAGSQRAEDFVAGEPYICYAAKPNSLVIRANGRIGKCTVALADERNDIGYISDEGKVVLNDKKLLPWIRGLETLDLESSGCPLSGLPANTLPSPFPEASRKIINISTSLP